MSQCFRKEMEKTVTYQQKLNKHRHEYNLEYILEITNINIHASAGYYNKKEYYRVLKCNNCNSFISYKSPGNYSGRILGNYEIFLKNNKLPFIYADTTEKNLFYNFSKLINVRLKK